jgi:uncharacterized protein
MVENWWLPAFALALISANLIFFTSAAVRTNASRYQNRRLRKERQDDLGYAAQLARLASQLGSRTTQGAIPWRILEVAEIIQESEDCRSFYLVDPYRQSLPEFLPGQYVMVRPALAGSFQTTRCYSLSSSPDHRYWRITVKRHGSQFTKNDRTGGLSAWLHESIGVGDCLFVGGPSGQFYLPRESTNELVLIAAGVGITPLASMLRWSIDKAPDRTVNLLYQVRDLDHWPLGRDLHSWQDAAHNANVYTFFSGLKKVDLTATANELPGHFHAGRVNGAFAAQFASRKLTDFYLCGPDTWMEQLRNDLVANGVDPLHIHWESFGSTATQTTKADLNEQSHMIEFQRSEIQAQWNDPDQSLWELARANRVELASGCLSGACGSCRVKLISGEVEYDRKIGVELATDECLTCVARPKTDVTLDA